MASRHIEVKPCNGIISLGLALGLYLEGDVERVLAHGRLLAAPRVPTVVAGHLAIRTGRGLEHENDMILIIIINNNDIKKI